MLAPHRLPAHNRLLSSTATQTYISQLKLRILCQSFLLFFVTTLFQVYEMCKPHIIQFDNIFLFSLLKMYNSILLQIWWRRFLPHLHLPGDWHDSLSPLRRTELSQVHVSCDLCVCSMYVYVDKVLSPTLHTNTCSSQAFHCQPS